MKKIINNLRTFLLLLVLFNFTSKSYSQKDYYPFPQTDAKWTILHTNILDEYFWEIREYETGDTITIENNLYRLLEFSCIENQYYAFREENKQIFFYIPSIGEVLVYDFNLKVGDTIFYYIDYYDGFKVRNFKCKSCGDIIALSVNTSEYTHYKVVKSIDKVILVDGSERKRFSLGYNYVTDIWIEGVGSIGGPLHPIVNLFTLCGDIYHFTCLRENQEMIYLTPNCTDCLCGHNSIIENPLSIVSIFPNPTTGELRVTSDKLQVTGIEIFDVYGRKLEIPHCVRNDVIPSVAQRNEESRTINISHLHAGIYFVRVGFESGNSVRKLVKQ